MFKNIKTLVENIIHKQYWLYNMLRLKKSYCHCNCSKQFTTIENIGLVAMLKTALKHSRIFLLPLNETLLFK